MSGMLKGIVLVLFLGLFTGPSWAGEVLSSLTHRDKFYDLVSWGDEVWAFGFPGHALQGDKSGQTWTAHSVPEKPMLYAFAAVSDQIGVASGPNGLLLRTTNRGQTWKPVKSGTINHLFDVAAWPETGEVWAVGHFNTIRYSKDKGATWTEQTYLLPEDAEDEPGLNSIALLSAKTALIVGEFGVILKTEDGGKTWRLIVPTATPSKPSENIADSAKNTPSPDAKPISTVALYDVTFKDTQTGAAVGTQGTVLLTRDAGETWESISVTMEQNLFAATLQGDMLYMVAQDGLFIRGSIATKPAWTIQKTGVYTWLNAIYFSSPKEGFIAGGRGSLLHTRDAGQTWSQLSGR